MLDSTVKLTTKDLEYKEIDSKDLGRSLLAVDKDGNTIIRWDNFRGVCKSGIDTTIKAGTKAEIDNYIKINKINKVEVIDGVSEKLKI